MRSRRVCADRQPAAGHLAAVGGRRIRQAHHIAVGGYRRQVPNVDMRGRHRCHTDDAGGSAAAGARAHQRIGHCDTARVPGVGSR